MAAMNNQYGERSKTKESELYCLCKQPYSAEDFMIECGKCSDWFHGRCIGIEEFQAGDIDVYHCPRCQKIHGPLVLKPKRNVKRHNYRELNDGTKVIRAGTVVFIRQLKTRKFLDGNDAVDTFESGNDFTIDALLKNGFSKPLIVNKKTGLGLKVPASDFSVYDVERHVGSMIEVHVIDVLKQEDLRMKMREWTEYYNCPVRTKVLNVISLEFSHTSLNDVVEAPQIVRDISWVENVWPEKIPEGSPLERPYVQKYCLMGVKDSYTDFHVDFGGTSVWYHVLRGEKIFYLIEPTEDNLKLYENWVTSSDQHQVFFGDVAKKCYKCHVKQGNTLFIPSGWIHAVLTPTDSLVFGGNFLHSFNVQLQLNIYCLEKRLSTPIKFLFPNYETTNWYAGVALLSLMRDYHSIGLKVPSLLHRNVDTVINLLKSWTSKKDEFFKFHKFQVPIELNHVKLVKSLVKELKSDSKFILIPNEFKSILAVSWSDEAKDRLKEPPKTVLKINLKNDNNPENSVVSSKQKQPIKMTLSKSGIQKRTKNDKQSREDIKVTVAMGTITSASDPSGYAASQQGFRPLFPSGDQSLKLKLNVSGISRSEYESRPLMTADKKTGDERTIQPVATDKNRHLDNVRDEIEAAKKELFHNNESHSNGYQGGFSLNVNRTTIGSSSASLPTVKDEEEEEEGGYYYTMPIATVKPQTKTNNRKRKPSEDDSDYDPSEDAYYEDAEFVYPRMDLSQEVDDDDCSWRPGQRKGKKPKRDGRLKKEKPSSHSKDDCDQGTGTGSQSHSSKPGTATVKGKESKRGGFSTSVTAKQRLGKLLKLDKLGTRYIRK